MTKNGRPVLVAPASSTFAIFGWSISARAWRSASNRGHDLFGVHAQLDDFKGDAAADRFLLFGHVHHATTAFANLLQELVSANTITGLFRWRHSDAHGRPRDLVPHWGIRRFQSLIFQEGDCILMNTEQGLDAQAQARIIGAGPIQIGGALAAGQLQGGAKEGYFAIGRGIHGLIE